MRRSTDHYYLRTNDALSLGSIETGLEGLVGIQKSITVAVPVDMSR